MKVLAFLLGIFVGWVIMGFLIGGVLFFIKLIKPTFSIDKYFEELEK